MLIGAAAATHRRREAVINAGVTAVDPAAILTAATVILTASTVLLTISLDTAEALLFGATATRIGGGGLASAR